MMRSSLVLLLGVTCAPFAAAQVGTAYCHGNGCPCANDDPAAGCGNHGLDGDPATGALLAGTGSADVFADDLVLTTGGVMPGQAGLVVMGEAKAGSPVGDGLLCVGPGAVGLWRFPPMMADAGGTLVQASVVSESQGFGFGAITSGATWNFQTWYRDPLGPCGNGSNFSNALTITFEAAGENGPIELDLVGKRQPTNPFFEIVRNVNEGTNTRVSIDPSVLPWLVGVTGDLYVVADKDALEWELDPALVDVRGGAQPWTIVAGTLQDNVLVADGGTLPGTVGEQLGIGYDVVLDVDRDGQLGPGDVVDGGGDHAGYHVVRDTVAPGPHAVTETLYSGGAMLEQNIFYPSDVANMGQLPLMVVSHGNGHNYQWYDHVGFHLASYGYVVMSHFNNTQPGIQAASLTTLTNTDHFLGNLDVIEGGLLDGHVDASRIAWMGHSRGGEGVVRAYDRLVEGDYVPQNFTLEAIRLVSSIAPTVFLAPGLSDPHDVSYHLWIGSADNDVTGGPDDKVKESFTLLERAESTKLALVLQGAGHAVFHNGPGGNVANGPCQVGKSKTHKVMLGYLLPLTEYFLEGDPAGKDFLWRPYEEYAPIGKPPNPAGCVVVSYELHELPEHTFVVDDFQSGDGPALSSSGQEVRWDVLQVTEDLLEDANGTLEHTGGEPMNGMTRAGHAGDTARGLVFEWSAPSFLEFDLDPARRNLADDVFLSFRAAQRTRHPETIAALEELTFQVTLVDELGGASTLDLATYGAGIVEPYQRSGLGAGVGWSAEFETVRLRLRDFRANGGAVDLARVETIRFEFGGAGCSPVGALGLDDVEIVEEDR